MSTSSSTLRMSGLNSGLDTESIVNALTATTKNKINTNQREVLKLQATQEAYRDIIDKLNTFQEKYFDILNSSTCLKSNSLFNSYTSSLSNSSGTNVNGVVASNSADSTPAVYNVTVNSVATQSTVKSGTASGKSIDFSNYADGEEYTMKVTMGGKSVDVTFSGTSVDEIRDQVNETLKEEFGSTNSGSGLVSMDESGKITALDKSAVTVTTPTSLQKEINLDISNLGTGNNTFSITVNGTTKTVTFSTVSSDYFSDIFDEYGNLKDSVSQSKINEFKQAAETSRQNEITEEYTAWKEGLDDTDKETVSDSVKQADLDEALNSAYEKAFSYYSEKAWAAELEADPETTTTKEEFIENYRSMYTADDFESAVEEYNNGGVYNSTVSSIIDDYNSALQKIEETDYSFDNLSESDVKAYFMENVCTVASQEDYLNDYTAEQAVEELGVDEGYFDDILDGTTGADLKEATDTTKIDLFKEVVENERQAEIYAAYEEWDKNTVHTVTYDDEGNEVTIVDSSVNDTIRDDLVDQAKEDALESLYETTVKSRASEAYAALSEEELADLKENYGVESEADYLEYYKENEYTRDDFAAEVNSGDVTDETTLAYQYQQQADKIDEDAENGKYDYENLTSAQKLQYFKDYVDTTPGKEEYLESYVSNSDAAAQAAKDLNKANIENNLNGLSFGTTKIQAEADLDNGTINIQAIGSLTGQQQAFSITANGSNATTIGNISETVSTAISSQVATTSTLGELGLESDENGNYNFSINGVSFSFASNITISDMMKKVNASEAGVKMTYTSLTNQFVLTANEYGKGTTIDFEDGAEGLLGALGFSKDSDGNVNGFTEGQNTNLIINGVEVESTSNSYTVDGTTFKLSAAAEGTEFTNEVTRDYSKAVDAIKSFVADYNQLIEDIYAYIDEEPDSDYYFLTDDDIDELELSETQQTKWETLAKKGLLYRDSTITNIMTKMRSVIYSTVTASDGNKIGLYTLGITTSSNYTDHGLLQYSDNMNDEDILATFEKYADEFSELFTDATNGIATQLESIIDSAVKTTGSESDRGTLVQKAGVSGTASATSNILYTRIQNLKDTIADLEERYEQQQDRYWSIYSNMETMIGNLNSQTSSISQLLGQ